MALRIENNWNDLLLHNIICTISVKLDWHTVLTRPHFCDPRKQDVAHIIIILSQFQYQVIMPINLFLKPNSFGSELSGIIFILYTYKRKSYLCCFSEMHYRMKLRLLKRIEMACYFYIEAS